MRYASYAMIALGASALGYFQLIGTESVQMVADAESLPMLFAGSALTTGLLMLTLSKGPPAHSQA